MGQRPISLLPIIYRVWTSSRAYILKEWLRGNAHSSAWGMGAGRGADTAAWVGAAEAEVAQALGLVALAGFIDCSKCYDHVIICALSRSAYRAGLGWLGQLAVDQYQSDRRVRWAGAVSRPISPVWGMPAG